MSNESHWHLNKSVPITLLFAIFLQTATGIWWASNIQSRVMSTENSLSQLNTNLSEENLRQWSRINAVEKMTEQTISQGRINTAILERLERQVSGLQDEIKETNNILREEYKNGD